MENQLPILFTRKKAAEELGVSEETLDRYRKAGKLGYLPIGDRIQYTAKHLIDFIESCEVKAKKQPSPRERTEIAKKISAEALGCFQSNNGTAPQLENI